jgi:hypothetical protein
MLDKLSDRSRTILKIAKQEAQRLNSEYIGTEHILLGIIEEGGGVAAKVLKNLNVDLKRIRHEIEKLFTTSTHETRGELPFSPSAKHVIELAGEAAGCLGHGVTGTEHILLGLIEEDEGIAAQVLTNLGLKLGDVRDMVLEVFGQNVKEQQGGNISALDQATATMEKMHQQSLQQIESARKGASPVESGPEMARQKLAEIQQRMSTMPPGPCNMRIWIFKDTPVPGKVALVFQNTKVFVSDIITVEGVPFDKQEAIAAAIAKECGGAMAYLMEPYRESSKPWKR